MTLGCILDESCLSLGFPDFKIVFCITPTITKTFNDIVLKLHTNILGHPLTLEAQSHNSELHFQWIYPPVIPLYIRIFFDHPSFLNNCIYALALKFHTHKFPGDRKGVINWYSMPRTVSLNWNYTNLYPFLDLYCFKIFPE